MLEYLFTVTVIWFYYHRPYLWACKSQNHVAKALPNQKQKEGHVYTKKYYGSFLIFKPIHVMQGREDS